ncbi:MAG: dTDP-glucose 4,6-dehydratase, partial [Microgenomates group bacterium LiPW_16]
MSNPLFHVVEWDVTKPFNESINNKLKAVNHIYHLASPASPKKYQQYPAETLLVNSYGTYLLLEKARNWDAKFLFASSSEVYGNPQQHPQRESYWGNVNP